MLLSVSKDKIKLKIQHSIRYSSCSRTFTWLSRTFLPPNKSVCTWCISRTPSRSNPRISTLLSSWLLPFQWLSTQVRCTSHISTGSGIWSNRVWRNFLFPRTSCRCLFSPWSSKSGSCYLSFGKTWYPESELFYLIFQLVRLLDCSPWLRCTTRQDHSFSWLLITSSACYRPKIAVTCILSILRTFCGISTPKNGTSRRWTSFTTP